MNYILIIFIFLSLTSCATVSVSPEEEVHSSLSSTITLADTRTVSSEGFVLSADRLNIINNGEKISIPRHEVLQIETIDRMGMAQRLAKGGTVGAGALALYSLYDVLNTAPEWGLIYVPAMAIIVVGVGAIGGAVGYVVGERTYYQLYPSTAESSAVHSQPIPSVTNDLSGVTLTSGLHAGLNVGAAMAYLPKVGDNTKNVGQASNVWSFVSQAELGLRVKPKWLVDGTFSIVSAYDQKDNFAASRSMSLFGLQATYFPQTEGFYYKGGVKYGIYSEIIEDITQPGSNGFGEILFESNERAMGVSASIGVANAVYGRIKLATELSAQGFVVPGKEPIALIAGTVGLHWY